MHSCEIGSCAGEASTSFPLGMDSILRQLEGLRRDELVWLNTYFTGRLRALPPSEAPQVSVQPGVATPVFPADPGAGCCPGAPLTTVPLSERIDDFNHSLDPWERTGAAPQGWAAHIQQSLLPIQGYIQLLRPHDTTLPFGCTLVAPTGASGDTDDAGQAAPRRLGKASESVSIFARAPVCQDTCRYCRVKPCDVAIAHDDHTCYDCEQRLLHPEGAPGLPWRPPLLPGCTFWCHLCSTQRCGLRDVHDLHLCMRCERRPAADPAPVGGGDPWAAVDDA